jgi:hypothetical protein
LPPTLARSYFSFSSGYLASIGTFLQRSERLVQSSYGHAAEQAIDKVFIYVSCVITGWFAWEPICMRAEAFARSCLRISLHSKALRVRMSPFRAEPARICRSRYTQLMSVTNLYRA